ncbi:MAG: hypothetical protein O7A08_13865 [SAR324 cluster bacterium]|nr:hypothetical protein [SAR324 cluster bacterium]MCZ6534034.1 hypothetical protein [SAR324 cluster bacterium]MCZ6558004.1 hypothetical protein [SAR324 cluster bacterium]MCZ6644691.1 hypothetical protein [SAR324 cluster bacterium]MCZ6842714.1 hypothetical protein [SAR324 cluster bacterium]
MFHLHSPSNTVPRNVNPGLVQNISPYLNPAHVLAPPRIWIESLLNGEYSWHFFRLRYKNLLRLRFREAPERFFGLLDASEGERPLYFACHCFSGPCHREVAVDFLEKLREQAPYRNRVALRTAALAANTSTPALLAVGG